MCCRWREQFRCTSFVGCVGGLKKLSTIRKASRVDQANGRTHLHDHDDEFEKNIRKSAGA